MKVYSIECFGGRWIVRARGGLFGLGRKREFVKHVAGWTEHPHSTPIRGILARRLEAILHAHLWSTIANGRSRPRG